VAKASYDIEVRQVTPMHLAAVRRQVAPGGVAAAWRPALDLVWAFVRGEEGLWTGGHNVFLYHHPSDPQALMTADFGVQVTRPFAARGDVQPVETPSGRVATTLHVGPPDRLRDAHAAIEAWCTEHGETVADASWEIYGDWGDDPETFETWVFYLLKARR
jgi:effector-binding domain-containing protein